MQAQSWEFPAGIPDGSACFDGHFPGNQIVPGAYLLALAEARLAEGGLKIVGARRIKFLSPLKPNEPFRIEATPGPSATTLRWFRAKQKIAEAAVTLRSMIDPATVA